MRLGYPVVSRHVSMDPVGARRGVLPPGAREEGHRLGRAAAVREARASEWPDREGRRTLDKMIGVARPESSKGPKAARSRAKAGNARTRIRWLDSVFARCR